MESEIGQGLQVSLLFPCASSILRDGNGIDALGTEYQREQQLGLRIRINESEFEYKEGWNVFGASISAGRHRVLCHPQCQDCMLSVLGW
ncbi:hypothetical protein Tco_0691481 [Tanacetum coccineum]